MTVRVAEIQSIDDIDALITVSRINAAELEPDIEFDEQCVRLGAYRILEDSDRSFMNAWVAYQDDKPIGYTVCYIGVLLFSPLKVASMQYWYVLPEYRRSRAAGLMLNIYERWAIDEGAFRIELGTNHPKQEDADKVSRLYTKRGYTKHGETFYRNL